MLLPALSKAREQAVRVQCGSNLRQIGLSCIMYSNQNNQWWPYSLGPNGPELGSTLIPTDSSRFGVFLGDWKKYTTAYGGDPALVPEAPSAIYMPVRKYLYCPGQRSPTEDPTGQFEARFSSYSYNMPWSGVIAELDFGKTRITTKPAFLSAKGGQLLQVPLGFPHSLPFPGYGSPIYWEHKKWEAVAACYIQDKYVPIANGPEPSTSSWGYRT